MSCQGILDGCPVCQGVEVRDPNVEAVRSRMLERSRVGIAKYGTTTTRTDLDRIAWLRHLQEELMDACVYIEAAINTMKGEGGRDDTPPSRVDKPG